jgi:proteasome beta subunit
LNIEEVIKKTGTTTLGMVAKDGVVLATDTRVTAGYFIANTNGKKMYQLDDHVGMTIAGVVADAQDIIDIMKYNIRSYKLERGKPMPISAVARLASNVFFYNRGTPLIVESLIGGFDQTGPSLYMVDFFGSITKETVSGTGSGSPIGLGVIDGDYREGLPLDDCIRLIIRAVTAAMKRDSATGNSFNVAVADKEGFRELTDDEKHGYLKSIQQN